MGVSQLCVSSGEHYHAMAGAHYSCFALTATSLGASSMGGSGIVSQVARTGCVKSLGAAVLATFCATLQKAGTYGPLMVGLGSSAPCFGRPGEICRAPCSGIPMCSPTQTRAPDGSEEQ
jgi:hypothetical protein